MALRLPARLVANYRQRRVKTPAARDSVWPPAGNPFCSPLLPQTGRKLLSAVLSFCPGACGQSVSHDLRCSKSLGKLSMRQQDGGGCLEKSVDNVTKKTQRGKA